MWLIKNKREKNSSEFLKLQIICLHWKYIIHKIAWIYSCFLSILILPYIIFYFLSFCISLGNKRTKTIWMLLLHIEQLASLPSNKLATAFIVTALTMFNPSLLHPHKWLLVNLIRLSLFPSIYAWTLSQNSQKTHRLRQKHLISLFNALHARLLCFCF